MPMSLFLLFKQVRLYHFNFEILCHVRGWPAISLGPGRQAVSILEAVETRSGGTGVCGLLTSQAVWAPDITGCVGGWAGRGAAWD